MQRLDQQRPQTTDEHHRIGVHFPGDAPRSEQATVDDLLRERRGFLSQSSLPDISARHLHPRRRFLRQQPAGCCCAQPSAPSSWAASASSVASSLSRPSSCAPIGRPVAVRPAGTLIPGQPSTFHGHAYGQALAMIRSVCRTAEAGGGADP